MAAAHEVLGRPRGPRAGATDGRAWLRGGLAVAALAALTISGLTGAHTGGVRGADPEISVGEGYGRWTGATPGWRSRSQILEDAGILKRR
jgi:hypothetical protein